MTELFKSPDDSHQHSLKILSSISAYDDYMDNLQVICDMGCGSGKDIMWWANAAYTDPDTNIEIPRNYKCFGVDLNLKQIPIARPKNLFLVEADFEQPNVSIKIDLMWSHDSFRYAINPVETLRLWNSMLNDNGALVLTVPQTVNIVYNNPVVRSMNGCYHSYNITNLMYMLAVNGFDCKDGHFVKYPNDPWIQCFVYKSEHVPMDPRTTTWYDLVDKKLLPDSAVQCISKYGYLRQETLQTHWLDGQFINWSKV